jgi:hypothetical protein
VIEEDRRMLCELHTDMKWVKKTLGNHLAHHEKYEVALIAGILLAVAGQLLGYFFK